MAFVEHPFSRIPRDELIQALSNAGERHAEQFPALLDELQNTIDGVDALHAIATLSNYGMMGGITVTGERQPLLKDTRFTQSHVELIQALALRTTADRRSYAPALPETIQKLLDGLPALAEAFHHRRLVQIETGRTQEEKAVLA